jgi:hypothetical protein
MPRKLYFRDNSKAPEIIRIFREVGVKSPTKIAEMTSTTPQNVCKTLKRHVPEWMPRMKAREFTIGLLAPDDMAWLYSEARKSGVHVSEMARALLIDGIEAAKEGESK